MKSERKKYIVYIENGKVDHSHEAEESYAFEDKEISRFKLLLAIITDNHFARYMADVLRYAIRHYESYRGNGAADVVLFQVSKKYNKIWKDKK